MAQICSTIQKAVQSDNSDNDSDEDDMEKAMMKKATEMKETKKKCRFQNTDTKTKNLVFIRTLLPNPCELAHTIFTDIFDSQVQKARYALRMLPVAVTCKANINQITETAKSLFKLDFETAFGHGRKFTTVCKIRNNNSLSRTAVLPSLSRIIQEMNPLHTLCHDEPDLVIIVEVIRNICCLSVVKDYFKYKKYNLHEIITPSKKGSDKSKEKEVISMERKVDAESENAETETTEAETEVRQSKTVDKSMLSMQDSEGSEVLHDLASINIPVVEITRATESIETSRTEKWTGSELGKNVTFYDCNLQDSESSGIIHDLKSVDEVETTKLTDNSECLIEGNNVSVMKDSMRVNCVEKDSNKSPRQELNHGKEERKNVEAREESSSKEKDECLKQEKNKTEQLTKDEEGELDL